MRCLVTGGAGFIGSHLCDRLVADGHEVTALDNLATGRVENLSRQRGETRFRFERVDASDFAQVAPCVQGMDWVFHLAALADIVPSIEDPLAYHRANVDGTAVVLEASRQAGVGRFLYAASSSCYGIPDRFPTSETAELRPEYPYALSKSLGEQLVLHWQHVYGLPAASLRLFNVYGPRSRTSGAYGAVFGVFLAQKLAGRPFTVVGDGRQTRDFTFVDDVVSAFVATAESGVSGEVMNVGSGSTTSVNRLVQLLGGDVVFVPERPGEPNCTLADIGKIERLVGWRPRTTFEQGVRTMLGCIDQWKTAPIWTPETIEEVTRNWFRFLARGGPA